MYYWVYRVKLTRYSCAGTAKSPSNSLSLWVRRPIASGDTFVPGPVMLFKAFRSPVPLEAPFESAPAAFNDDKRAARPVLGEK